MYIKNFVDIHTHTDNSPDGNHNTMYLCETAVEKGLRAIAFTDHVEADVYKRDHYDMVARQSYFDICKAQDAYNGEILVLKGIELGEGHYAPQTSDEILSAQKYDLVIGSIHNLPDTVDFYFYPTFEGIDPDEQMNAYFDEIIKMIEWGKFDTLGHLTYPFRYFYERSQIHLTADRYKGKIDEILSLLAEKELALEINAKGLKTAMKELCPTVDVVKRFHELGGKKITVGSDSHFAHDLGVGIFEAEECALAAGFNTKFIFQNREPIELEICH